MDSNYRRRVASEVRGAAARAQVSHEELALAAGVSRVTFSRSMTAKRAFTLDELALIAQRLEIPVSSLIPVAEVA